MKLSFLLISFIFGINAVAYSQSESDKMKYNLSCDTVSIVKFTKYVKKNLADIKKNDTFSIKKLLEIIKIAMTPELTRSQTKKRMKIFKEFGEIYWDKIIKIATNDAQFGYAPLRGMVGFSKRFNMYLTPPSNPSDLPCHNYYLVNH